MAEYKRVTRVINLTYLSSQKERFVFQPSIFQTVSFRVGSNRVSLGINNWSRSRETSLAPNSQQLRGNLRGKKHPPMPLPIDLFKGLLTTILT